jgi:hypothetical protein
MIGSILLSVSMLCVVSGLSPRVPSAYEIRVYLDDSSHTMTGRENITFVNPTTLNLDTIAFHLYPNAFKDTATVYLREYEKDRKDVADGNIAKSEVSNIIIDGRFFEPEEYDIDGTRLYIPLRKQLAPGQSIKISLDFEVLIPKMIGHFGYDSDGVYLVAHCLPILCGYQDDRLIDWEYHATSEFFSNFSYYDVTLELPGDFKVVSTGVISKESETDSTVVWRAVADTVIDFAFVCGPDMLDYDSEFNGIRLKYLIKDRHKGNYAAIDSTVKNSLQYCGDRLYPYPYNVFSLVDAGFTTSGLELPGLIIVRNPRQDSELKRYLKLTIAHEVAHQWFYATIATNEFEEPWLDEGFASFFENEIAIEYGFDLSPLLFSNYFYSERYSTRFFGLLQEAEYPIDLKSWDYPDWHAYAASVYYRAWMVLRALENVLGDSSFAHGLKTYAENYRFKHPDQKDFIKSVSESSSTDLKRFVEMFIDGTARVDYAVQRLRYDKNEPESDSGKVKYTIHVDVVRKLDGILPQVVTIGLEDGSTIERTWDGVGRKEKISFEADSRPVYASIDKKISYEIDENENNNTIYVEGHVTRMISFEWDVIFIIEFLASIFL